MKKKIDRTFMMVIIIEVLLSIIFFLVVFFVIPPKEWIIAQVCTILGAFFAVTPFFTRMVWYFTSLLGEEDSGGEKKGEE